MATIGKLAVALSAQTGPFTKGLKSAGGVVRNFGAGIARGAVTVAKWGAALTAVAVGGLAAIVNSTRNAIDENAKLANALGITTAELIGLQFAGRIAGVSQDELATAMRRMEKNVSDAILGLSTAGRAFDTLGLSAQELAQMSPVEQLKAIADAFVTIPTQADRARVAQDLFGRSGLAMVNILQEGSAGIEALMQETVRLGSSLTDIDAAKVEQANDALTRVAEVILGIKQRITVEVAPFIEALAMKLIGTGDVGQKTGQFIVNAIEWVAKAIGVTADVLRVFRIGWNLLQAVVNTVIGAILRGIGQVMKGLSALVNLLPGVETEWGEFTDRLGEDIIKLAQEDMNTAIDLFEKPMLSNQIADFFDQARMNAQAAAEQVAATRQELRATGDTVREISDDLRREAERIFEDTRSPLEKFRTEIAKLEQLRTLGLIDEDTFQRAILKAQNQLRAELDKGIEAPELGAREVRSLAAINVAANQTIDPLEKVEQNTQKQLAEQKKGNSSLASIDEGVRRMIELLPRTVSIGL